MPRPALAHAPAPAPALQPWLVCILRLHAAPFFVTATSEMQSREIHGIDDGRRRVVVEGVDPEIDGGRFPIKRVVGDEVVVEADAFTDGHDAISCVLLYRNEEDAEWTETPMQPLVNDRWRGSFRVVDLGRYRYALLAWVDHFQTWRRDLVKRVAAGQDVALDLLIGADLVEQAAARSRRHAAELAERAAALRGDGAQERRVKLALDEELDAWMAAAPDREFATFYDHSLAVTVDPVRARFSAWYEFFPRSAGEGGRHGTFHDAEKMLRYAASLGFDVVYLPPIHPIGMSKRKGRNNAVTAEPGEVGSPWAIGAAEGGHKAVHPELGTLDDFRRFVSRARELRIDVALDIAFQVSPDHPYAREHPEWFRRRPDGTIQYAENPPKKYEDIYPFDFETAQWRALWDELLDVVLHWCRQGVRVFRVDNPHTKPFALWEWLIAETKRQYPETIFLAEAFTRPKVMYRLAKLGFTQSYTYFSWRGARWDLEQYLTELTQTEVKDYFRPNFWPNTPDILTEQLQTGGRPMFLARLILASTLAANYGIYGPAFELMEHAPRSPGSEEYLDSEKYQLRSWDLQRSDSLAEIIARINAIRREHPALQRNDTLRFHPVDNEQLIVYSKHSRDLADVVLVAVNLDPHNVQSGWVDFPFADFGIEADEAYQVHDLLGNARHLWHGGRNYVELNPQAMPAHVFVLRRRNRSERDFEYYL